MSDETMEWFNAQIYDAMNKADEFAHKGEMTASAYWMGAAMGIRRMSFQGDMDQQRIRDLEGIRDQCVMEIDRLKAELEKRPEPGKEPDIEALFRAVEVIRDLLPAISRRAPNAPRSLPEIGADDLLDTIGHVLYGVEDLDDLIRLTKSVKEGMS